MGQRRNLEPDPSWFLVSSVARLINARTVRVPAAGQSRNLPEEGKGGCTVVYGSKKATG